MAVNIVVPEMGESVVDARVARVQPPHLGPPGHRDPVLRFGRVILHQHRLDAGRRNHRAEVPVTANG